MPIYIYEHIEKHGDCPKEFEHYEKITSEGLDVCPVCGNPVRRIIKSVNFNIDRLAPSNLNELGFKKLIRKDKGVYEAENKTPGEARRKLVIDKNKAEE